MKGFVRDKKFHPINPHSKVRKSRDSKEKTQGIRLQRRGLFDGMVRSDTLRIRNLSSQSTPQLMNLLSDPRLSDADFRFVDAEVNRRKLGDVASVKREIAMANSDGREPRIPANFISKNKNEAKSCWNGSDVPVRIRIANRAGVEVGKPFEGVKGWGQLSTDSKRKITRAMIIQDPELRCFKQ